MNTDITDRSVEIVWKAIQILEKRFYEIVLDSSLNDESSNILNDLTIINTEFMKEYNASKYNSIHNCDDSFWKRWMVKVEQKDKDGKDEVKKKPIMYEMSSRYWRLRNMKWELKHNSLWNIDHHIEPYDKVAYCRDINRKLRNKEPIEPDPIMEKTRRILACQAKGECNQIHK